jgi:hypothetical protein
MLDYRDEYHEEDYWCCIGCDERQEKLNNAAHWLEGILERLYATDNLNVAALENEFDELCGYLDVKLPKGEMPIQRSKPVRDFSTMIPIKEWVKINNQYLQSLKEAL